MKMSKNESIDILLNSTYAVIDRLAELRKFLDQNKTNPVFKDRILIGTIMYALSACDDVSAIRRNEIEEAKPDMEPVAKQDMPEC